MKNLCDIILNIGDDLHHITVEEEGGLFRASDNIISGRPTARLRPKHATIFAMLYLYSPLWLSDREVILSTWSCSTSTWRSKRQTYRVAISHLRNTLPDRFVITKKTNGIKLEIVNGTEQDPGSGSSTKEEARI